MSDVTRYKVIHTSFGAMAAPDPNGSYVLHSRFVESQLPEDASPDEILQEITKLKDLCEAGGSERHTEIAEDLSELIETHR